ncbi:MAG: hypothetical protein KF887_18180 [Paracoccaceae bacterium]|nr:MAG: hypothetical protein KF887_18180 [Paracoccaceae bacterium]
MSIVSCARFIKRLASPAEGLGDGCKQIERGQLVRKTATARLDRQDPDHPRLRVMRGSITRLAVGPGVRRVLEGRGTVTLPVLDGRTRCPAGGGA